MDTADHKLDELSRKVLHTVGEQQAPAYFTTSVMDRILEEATVSKKIAYTPLISKGMWIGIAAVALVLLGFALSSSMEPTAYTDMLQDATSAIPSWEFSFDLPDFNFGSLTVYCMLTLAILFSVEIFRIRNRAGV